MSLICNLRPFVITVGATVLALFPLAVHGGPLWQPAVLFVIHHLDDFNRKSSWESETLSLYRPLNGRFNGE